MHVFGMKNADLDWHCYVKMTKIVVMVIQVPQCVQLMLLCEEDTESKY